MRSCTGYKLPPIGDAVGRKKKEGSIRRIGAAEGVPDHLLLEQVHIAIPPKYPVASVSGFLKGKSAIAMARLCGKERNFTGEHFSARG